MSHGRHKAEKLTTARRLYLLTTDGLTDIQLAKALQIDRATAYRYRKELQTTEVSEGRYTLDPSTEDIELALAVLQRASRRDPH